MPTALFCRANFDLASLYLSTYSSKLMDFAKNNGYEVVDLYDDDKDLPDNLATFETQIEKKPTVLIGAGHGNTTIFTGQDMEVLIKQGVNDDACSGIPTYLWSCLTGASLGTALVQNTCPAFYGYREDFTFIYHPDYEQTPLEDPYARAFFDSGLATGYAFLLGKTPQEVYQTTIDRYNYWHDYWLKQDDPMQDDILTWLTWDRDNFVTIIKGGTELSGPETTGVTLPSILLPLGAAGLMLLFISRL